MNLSDLIQRAKGLPAPKAKAPPAGYVLKGWIYRDRYYGTENYTARSGESAKFQRGRWRSIHCVWLTQDWMLRKDSSVFNTLRLSTQT